MTTPNLTTEIKCNGLDFPAIESHPYSSTAKNVYALHVMDVLMRIREDPDFPYEKSIPIFITSLQANGPVMDRIRSKASEAQFLASPREWIWAALKDYLAAKNYINTEKEQ
jgi:hypothetical protein